MIDFERIIVTFKNSIGTAIDLILLQLSGMFWSNLILGQSWERVALFGLGSFGIYGFAAVLNRKGLAADILATNCWAGVFSLLVSLWFDSRWTVLANLLWMTPATSSGLNISYAIAFVSFVLLSQLYLYMRSRGRPTRD